MPVDYKEIKRMTDKLVDSYLAEPSESLKERIILLQTPIVESNARKLFRKLKAGRTTEKDLVQYGMIRLIQDFDKSMEKVKSGEARRYSSDKFSYWSMCSGLDLESELSDHVQRKLRKAKRSSEKLSIDL